MKTILVHPSRFEHTFQSSPAGAVFFILLHGCEWPPELRNNPPRIRLLEPGRQGVAVACELLDDWPGAPDYWPPRWSPNAEVSP